MDKVEFYINNQPELVTSPPLDPRYSICADAVVADLLKLKSVQQAAVAGSCRRRRETAGDLDVLVTASESAASPNARLIAWVSPLSPTGVDVACGFI